MAANFKINSAEIVFPQESGGDFSHKTTKTAHKKSKSGVFIDKRGSNEIYEDRIRKHIQNYRLKNLGGSTQTVDIQTRTQKASPFSPYQGSVKAIKKINLTSQSIDSREYN